MLGKLFIFMKHQVLWFLQTLSILVLHKIIYKICYYAYKKFFFIKYQIKLKYILTE